MFIQFFLLNWLITLQATFLSDVIKGLLISVKLWVGEKGIYQLRVSRLVYFPKKPMNNTSSLISFIWFECCLSESVGVEEVQILILISPDSVENVVCKYAVTIQSLSVPCNCVHFQVYEVTNLTFRSLLFSRNDLLTSFNDHMSNVVSSQPSRHLNRFDAWMLTLF